MPSSKAGGGKNKKQPAEITYNIIEGTTADDVITTDETADFQTTAGADEIFGLAGTDVIDGGDGDDIVHGGDDWDILSGGSGNDTIYGDAGDDFIFADAGSDTIDGGDGYDTLTYYGELDVDYSISELTEIQGKGRDRTEVVVGYQVASLDGSGDVDTIYNVEEIVFISAPPGGDIVTQGDLLRTYYGSAVTFDVLANDYILGGNLGEGLELTNILDIQIDLDGDGVNDFDLIPDDATLADFQGAEGVTLTDGSILYLNPDGTLTWDPNGAYDTKPGSGEPFPSIYFWYEASDIDGNTAYGDVSIGVTYDVPLGTIEFEYMQIYDQGLADIFGWYFYVDGPEDNYEFFVTQLSTAGGGIIEDRDVEANGDFNYDFDADDEYRVWTDVDGTTHEMNVVNQNDQLFNLQSITFTGVDEGDMVTIEYYSLDGSSKLGEDVVNFDLLTPVATPDGDYYVYYTDETDIGQVSVIADAGDEVFVDDLVLV